MSCSRNSTDPGIKKNIKYRRLQKEKGSRRILNITPALQLRQKKLEWFTQAQQMAMARSPFGSTQQGEGKTSILFSSDKVFTLNVT